MRRGAVPFARRLQDLREARGVTQTELARKAGVSRPALAKLEADEGKPDWSTVCKLAVALGVSVAAFDQEGQPAESSQKRLLDAARAYARAYDQVEQKSRDSEMGSVESFAMFQEAQVELNLAALDLFAGQLRTKKR